MIEKYDPIFIQARSERRKELEQQAFARINGTDSRQYFLDAVDEDSSTTQDIDNVESLNSIKDLCGQSQWAGTKNEIANDIDIMVFDDDGGGVDDDEQHHRHFRMKTYQEAVMSDDLNARNSSKGESSPSIDRNPTEGLVNRRQMQQTVTMKPTKT